jgi:hypothetical protein
MLCSTMAHGRNNDVIDAMIDESSEKRVGPTRVQNGVLVPLVHERPERQAQTRT